MRYSSEYLPQMLSRLQMDSQEIKQYQMVGAESLVVSETSIDLQGTVGQYQDTFYKVRIKPDDPSRIILAEDNMCWDQNAQEYYKVESVFGLGIDTKTYKYIGTATISAERLQ